MLPNTITLIVSIDKLNIKELGFQFSETLFVFNSLLFFTLQLLIFLSLFLLVNQTIVLLFNIIRTNVFIKGENTINSLSLDQIYKEHYILEIMDFSVKKNLAYIKS